MKRIFVLILCLASSYCFSQIKMGVEGGLSIANFRPQKRGGMQQDTSINAFRIGIKAEVSIYKSFYLQTALLYSENGSSYFIFPFPDGPYSGTTIRIYYLQLPIDLIYKIKMGKQVVALLGSGIYIARGLWGREKGYYHDGFINGSTFHTVDDKVVFNITNGDPFANDLNHVVAVKPFDFGYNIILGMEWKNLQFKATMTNGLSHVFVTPSYTNVSSFKIRDFSFTLGYLLPVKK